MIQRVCTDEKDAQKTDDMDVEDPGVHMEDDEITDEKMILKFRRSMDEADLADKEEYVRTLQSLGATSLKDTVSEIYAPPRVTAMAHRLGLRKGFALDLTIIDPDDGKTRWQRQSEWYEKKSLCC